MTQAEIEKLHKAGAIAPSTSQYVSCCHTGKKHDGTVRVVQDFRGLNALLKAQSGGLGDLLIIYNQIDQSAYFSCLDLASGSLQLMIHEVDRYLIAFCEAEGKLWDYVRCGVGLKAVPLDFANYIGGSIMRVKEKVCATGSTTSSFQPAHLESNSSYSVKPSTVYGKASCREIYPNWSSFSRWSSVWRLS